MLLGKFQCCKWPNIDNTIWSPGHTIGEVDQTEDSVKNFSVSIYSSLTLLYYFLKGPFQASFSLFSSFQYSWQKMFDIIFANYWIWTADLWNWKQPLYQLSHHHCPICVTLMQNFVTLKGFPIDNNCIVQSKPTDRLYQSSLNLGEVHQRFASKDIFVLLYENHIICKHFFLATSYLVMTLVFSLLNQLHLSLLGSSSVT